jgi:hypothetical protein
MGIMTRDEEAPELHRAVRRHLAAGWLAVLLFLTLGAVLEMLHGYKVGWYLDVGNSARRLMWTLAHAHGTLLGMLNILFALTVRHLSWAGGSQRVASAALLGATVLLPGGFFLGGIVIYAGDPGLGILLVPVGGLGLLLAVAFTAAAVMQAPRPERASPPARTGS